MQHRRVVFLLSVALALGALPAVARAASSPRATLSLAGEWRFALDPRSQGVAEGWFRTKLADQVKLPGTTDENGKGSENKREETGGWSRLYEYDGPAWYQREVSIPASWKGKRVTLTLERTKRAHVWVDETEIGEQDGICTPQLYDVTRAMAPGRHAITIRVAPGPFPRGVGGHQLGGMQTNWNGILGRLELAATDPVWIEAVQVTPDVPHARARVRVTVGNATGAPARGTLSLGARSWNSPKRHTVRPQSVKFTAEGAETTVEAELAMGAGMLLWDEFSPALYRMEVSLRAEAGRVRAADARAVEFGMRQFRRHGTQFEVNGKAIFLRGTHDACHFPLTGYPAMDTEAWVRLFQVAKAYGINHYRFHTWCPPEAAFAAADRVGLYLQPELPSNGGFSFGEDPEHDAFCRAEGERILRAYGSHPSFVMLALGNEIGYPKSANRQAMSDLVSRFRALDGRRLYAEGSNCQFWDPSLNANDDYWTTVAIGPEWGKTKRIVRGSFATADGGLGHINGGPPGTMTDYRAAIEGIPVPVIGHEVGQYSVFPDFREMAKYTGVLRLRNFEAFRERLWTRGMLDEAEAFVKASGALVALCYREEIEAALRTPGFGGFQLLDLVDNQEQGTSTVGILNSFMESKGLITPEAWREFCCETVPLVRLPRYTWTTGEAISAQAEVAHYGPAPLARVASQWTLRDAAGKTVASGVLPAVDIPQGRLTRLGVLQIPLGNCPAPAKLVLELRLQGTRYVNHYPLWVYPPRSATTPPAGVTVSRRLDRRTLETLAAGGRVALFPEPGRIEKSVPGAFQTDFWNSAMFKGQPGTLGILCDPAHPALAGFPTEFHSNWQWWHLVKNARPILLDETPADFRPVVQEIDNFTRNHKLGLIFEARVGPGRLLVCASDLLGMGDRPEARQLLASLLAYMGSDRFRPAKALSPETLKEILAPGPFDLALRKPATASSSEDEKGNAAGRANDGRPETRWCAADGLAGQWWQVDLEQPEDVAGCEITWEQEGRRYQYLVEGSADGHIWTSLSDQRRTSVTAQVQRLAFQALGIRFVRVTITGVDRAWASLREVRVFAAE